MDLRRRTLAVHLPFAFLLGGLIGVWNAQAWAEDSYPSKVIHLVVTTAAGGADDFVARTVAQRLSATMGRPIIIENEPAGNGSVAAGEVARAPADGYTLMMVVDSTLTINPHLYKTINYDVFRDFTPISIISRLPTVLLARADLPANNVQELIALARARPGKLNYASTGVGTVLHVGMEMFKIATKTDIVHVPYRSTPGAQNDLMAGRIDVMLAGIGAALSHNDKLKVLGRVDGFDQDEAESKRDERAVILRRLLASKCDTLKALELANRLFDACPRLVECFRKEGGYVFGVGSIRDCRTYSASACGFAI